MAEPDKQSVADHLW